MIIKNSFELLPETQRHEVWNQVISETFCPMTCEFPEAVGAGFTGQLQTNQLENFGLAQVHTSPLDVYRHKRHIAQMTDEYYLIKFQLEGQGVLTQCRNEAVLSPGDFVVCSTSEPYELHFRDFCRQAVLTIPQKNLNELVKQPEQFLGRRMAANVGTNGLLSQFVYSLLERIDTFEPALVQRVEANILDLLVTSLSFDRPQAERVDRDTRDEHLFRIKNFIYKHLKDPQLTPHGIARAHNISTRYLHMLFKGKELSVARYIQQQRLDACRNSLANPEMNSLGASQIAYKWGFNDASHFSRSFKAHFGITPSHYRKVTQQK